MADSRATRTGRGRRAGPDPWAPWYGGGLRFECTRCGNCCRGGPGFVRVTGDEMRDLARHLAVSLAQFRRRYTRRVGFGWRRSLVQKPNLECVFWDSQRGCTVYGDRPRQCRTWPFWRNVVATRATWEEAGQLCPGTNHGELHAAELVELTSNNDGTFGGRRRRTDE